MRWSPGAGLDWQATRDHAATCDVCGPLLRVQRSAQASLRSLSGQVKSARTSDCPDETVWLLLAGNALRGMDPARLIEHASACDYCGQRLREATDDLNSDLSADERERVRRLPSSNPKWQRDLSRRMAGSVSQGSSRARQVATETNSRSRNVVGWLWWKQISWPLFAVAAVAILATVGIWVQRTYFALPATNRMLARAYTEQRSILLRFPGAEYGPIRQSRGSQSSRYDQPLDLLDARVQIARNLARNPSNPGWLQAKARADILEGNYQSAIDALQQAVLARPTDTSLESDLATAHFQRAEANRPGSLDYERAADLLAICLRGNPRNSVALFNRAVVLEHLGDYRQAMSTWDEYLKVDTTSAWSNEARQHRGDLRQKLDNQPTSR